MILYFCKSCRKVHYDEDFCVEEGDLEINNWEEFLKSVDRIKEAKRRRRE